MTYVLSPERKARYRRILSLGLPIVGGMVSQNVINLVDTAMVGSLGDIALAAVGTGSFIAFMAVSVVMGLSAGVQAIVARRVGEGKTDELAVALNGALVIALIAGLLLSTGYWLSADSIFSWVNSDPEVLALGVPYIELRVWTITAVGVNMAFRGYWNGTDRPMLYLRTLILIHSSNILLNYLFIFGNFGFPELGTFGAAIGTTASMFLGCVYYFYLGFKHAKGEGFCARMCTRPVMKSLLRLTIPNSLQQLFFAAGYTVLFWIIGKVGTAETAAANVLVNLMLVAILPSIALGIASTTLVGQALGKGDPDDAYAWGWDVVRVAFVTLLVMGAAMILFPELWLGVFLHNPETLELARVPLMVFGAAIAIDGSGLVLMQSLLGAGDNKIVMYMSVGAQWLFFLPAAFWVGPTLGWGLLGIWTVQAFYRILLTVFFALRWRGRAWAAIQV